MNKKMMSKPEEELYRKIKKELKKYYSEQIAVNVNKAFLERRKKLSTTSIDNVNHCKVY